MPATITHSYFAQDVYDILNEEIRNIIDINKFRMFAQSFDSLMFYNLFSFFPGKKIRRLSEYFHTNKTKEFFINMLNIMKEKRLVNDTECFSLLAGFICHYVLDSNIHPFIVYKSGVFNKNIANTFKYNNIHMFIESYIDVDMVKRREKINPYKFRLGNFCFDLKEFSINLDYLIDTTFYKTYKIKKMSYIYYKSLKQMKNALKIFRQDKYGIKKFFYKFIDTFTPANFYRFEFVSYHCPIDNRHDFLNISNKLWRNPSIYTLTSNESFVDLYLKSIIEAENIIISCYEYLNGKSIDLNKIFTNKNYVTGLDCDLNKKLKYFEF